MNKLVLVWINFYVIQLLGLILDDDIDKCTCIVQFIGISERSINACDDIDTEISNEYTIYLMTAIYKEFNGITLLAMI